MGGTHHKAGDGFRQPEGNKTGLVADHIVALAGGQGPGAGFQQRLEARLIQGLPGIFHRVKAGGAFFNKGKEFTGNWIHKCIASISYLKYYSETAGAFLGRM